MSKYVITGGAGYIGSAVTAHLLSQGHEVAVVDELHYGAHGLSALRWFPAFSWRKLDVVQGGPELVDALKGAECVVHLAALVGFPACERAGRERTWAVNVEGTRRAYEAARAAGVSRFVFSSSYSNYGVAAEGELVTEESVLRPLSTYAESKVEAEAFLMSQPRGRAPAVTCLRLATVFGVSPRTRFDLMVNQFALQAHRGDTIVLYQEDFRRTFIHVRDVAHAVERVSQAPIDSVASEIFNIGGDALNSTKQALIEAVRRQWPSLKVERRQLDLKGDMRSLHVSFEKVKQRLGYVPAITIAQGLRELAETLSAGWFCAPHDDQFRNHPALVV